MPGISKGVDCCASESGSSQYTADISTACHPLTHSSLPSDGYEGILLSAWVVVVYGYYNKTDTGLLQVNHRGGNERQPELDKVQYSSFSTSAKSSAKSLRHSLSRPNANMTSVPVCDIHDDFVAVFLPPATQDNARGGSDPIATIAEVCRPRLMLAVRTDNQQLHVNLYSHSASPASFRLCGMINSLEKAISCVMESPSQSISTMNIVSDYDISRLNGWRVEPKYDRLNCVHGLINRHYHDHPLDTAISTTSGDVTYEQLGRRSAVVAAQLRVHGVRERSRVGFRMTKSSSAIVILVGIMRAGAAYVAIDPSCPADRMAAIIESAGIKHMVCDNDGPACHDKIKFLDPGTLEQGETADWSTEKYTNPEATAYIMFTSGSTGIPKGAVHLQQGVAGSILEVVDTFSIAKETRFLQYASFSFDASICEIFAPLAAGGVVCVPSEEQRVDDLQKFIRRLQVTDASLTPAVVQQLAPDSIPLLERLYIGGEALKPDLIKTWSQKVRLSNIYGTTETGVWDTVKLELQYSDNAKNIGRGIGATCWIVDPANTERPLPVGAEGEILIQGPYIGQGYLDDPEKTSVAFLEPPQWIQDLTGDQTSPVYRTGDMASYNENGDILFSGRQSGFVKIRGLRVDLGEIEACLTALFPKAKSGVVVSELDEQSSDKEIVAFIETSADSNRSLVDYVRTELASQLPSYMLPAVVVPVEAMPLTDSKKINRPALRERLEGMESSDLMPFRSGGSSIQEWEHIDPERWIAVRLTHAIIDMLEENRGESMNFLRGLNFPLSTVGLTSIQLMHLSRLIRQQWGKKVTLAFLHKPGVTVSDIDDFISNEEPRPQMTEQKEPMINVIEQLDTMKLSLNFPSCTRKQIVFCTSVTGFLGSYILRSLLECPDVDRIIGLVRAENETQGREKMKQQAVIGQWWKEEFDSRIDIWTGDLSQPMLGLAPECWSVLTGSASNAHIDAIIHNGARVHWVDTFQNLKAANADSTVEILKALASRLHPCPITYVSGGYLPSPGETREAIADKLSTANGYDQTKYLSQLLVEEYNAWLEGSGRRTNQRAQTIQPGYIVGTRTEGIAHTEDFLWRFAYTVVSSGVIFEEVRQSYIPLAGADQISALTVDGVLGHKHASQEVLHCRDGMYVFNFCDILSAKTGKKIQVVGLKEWFDSVRSDIDNAAADHPFLPVLDWFEENYWQFSSDVGQPDDYLFDQKEIYAAVEKSVEYLVSIGYLPSVDRLQGKKLKPDHASLFRRSTQ